MSFHFNKGPSNVRATIGSYDHVDATVERAEVRLGAFDKSRRHLDQCAILQLNFNIHQDEEPILDENALKATHFAVFVSSVK